MRGRGRKGERENILKQPSGRGEEGGGMLFWELEGSLGGILHGRGQEKEHPSSEARESPSAGHALRQWEEVLQLFQ